MTEKLKKTLLLIYRWIYRIIFGYARISLVAVVGIVSAQVVAETFSNPISAGIRKSRCS